ncbi:MAG TPA: PilN domain-containing protein [Rhodocyclaceae bacterium]|nr:PilN domain-containing protein [Rhodocyclaceae bacterium]
MQPLDLDFQPRPYSAAGIALLVAGLLASGAALVHYRGGAEELSAQQGELARLQQPPRGRVLPRAGDDQEMQQMVQAASVVARDIQRPWEALFKALEEAKTDEIALLTLNPDASRGAVQIAGEAKSRDAILAFVDRLGQGGVLKNVFLAEDQLQQQDPEKPYRFLITADWAGTAP